MECVLLGCAVTMFYRIARRKSGEKQTHMETKIGRQEEKIGTNKEEGADAFYHHIARSIPCEYTHMEEKVEITTTDKKKWRLQLQQQLMNYQGQWNLTPQMIDAACDLILADQAHLEVKGNNLKLFLYAKAMLNTEDKGVRQSSFHELLSGTSKKTKKALKRLERIVVRGPVKQEKMKTMKKQFFTQFVESHVEWQQQGKSWVAFRDHPLLQGAYVERVQKAGLCFMHAPVVLQHYVVAMNTKDKSKVGVMDMPMFLRRNANCKYLWSHVHENRGGNSFELLRTIMREDKDEDVTWLDCSTHDEAEIKKSLHQFGPALVSSFRVHADFGDKDTITYRGKPTGKFEGLHSMLLVGYRHEKDGKILYLLQNWWEDKPFIEVDTAYLAKCYPALWFVKTRTGGYKMPQEFAKSYDTYVKMEHDAPESLMYENSEVC